MLRLYIILLYIYISYITATSSLISFSIAILLKVSFFFQTIHKRPICRIQYTCIILMTLVEIPRVCVQLSVHHNLFGQLYFILIYIDFNLFYFNTAFDRPSYYNHLKIFWKPNLYRETRESDIVIYKLYPDRTRRSTYFFTIKILFSKYFSLPTGFFDGKINRNFTQNNFLYVTFHFFNDTLVFSITIHHYRASRIAATNVISPVSISHLGLCYITFLFSIVIFNQG